MLLGRYLPGLDGCGCGGSAFKGHHRGTNATAPRRAHAQLSLATRRCHVMHTDADVSLLYIGQRCCISSCYTRIVLQPQGQLGLLHLTLSRGVVATRLASTQPLSSAYAHMRTVSCGAGIAEGCAKFSGTLLARSVLWSAGGRASRIVTSITQPNMS